MSLAVGLNYNVRFVAWIMIAAAVWLGAGLADLTRYYLGPDWTVVELPRPGSVNQIVHDERDAQAAAEATHNTPTAKQSWIIYSRPFHGDPHGLLLETIAARQFLDLAATLPGVSIYRTERQQIAAK